MHLARTMVVFKPMGEFTTKFYYNNCEKRTYAESKAYCEALGMKIATFRSDADVFLAREMKNCVSYVGATRNESGKMDMGGWIRLEKIERCVSGKK
eukprot:UN14200